MLLLIFSQLTDSKKYVSTVSERIGRKNSNFQHNLTKGPIFKKGTQ